MFFLNKNINLNNKEVESKMKNPTHNFRKMNLALQLTYTNREKSSTVTSWARERKNGAYLQRLFCPIKMF